MIYITKDVTGPWAAYADDFKLSACYPRGEATNRAERVHKLQMDVNSLADASRSCNLKLNCSKCAVMRFGKRIPNVTIPDYEIDGVPLK